MGSTVSVRFGWVWQVGVGCRRGDSANGMLRYETGWYGKGLVLGCPIHQLYPVVSHRHSVGADGQRKGKRERDAKRPDLGKVRISISRRLL